MERNDDDWFVPDCSLDYIGEVEYKMYLKECAEEYEECMNEGD